MSEKWPEDLRSRSKSRRGNVASSLRKFRQGRVIASRVLTVSKAGIGSQPFFPQSEHILTIYNTLSAGGPSLVRNGPTSEENGSSPYEIEQLRCPTCCYDELLMLILRNASTSV